MTPISFTRERRPILRAAWRRWAAGIAGCAACLALIGVLPASAQLVTGRLTTSFYTWERFDSAASSTVYLRGVQTVQLSFARENLSLHTYLSGAMMTDQDAFTTRVYNFYLRWASIGRALDLNLGRQAVYAGVGSGTIDGLSAKLHLFKDRVTVFGFGGAAPAIGYRGLRSNFSDNLSLGGQIVTTALPGARIGLSYLNRKEERDPYWTLRARDTAYTPVPYYVTFEPEAEELLGGDLYYSYGEVVSVYGRVDHDLKNEEMSRLQGSVRVSATDRLAFTAEYLHRLPRIRFNSIFSTFVRNAVDEIEGGAEYALSPLTTVFARVAGVTYEGEKSARWTAGLNSNYGSLSYSGSNGYAGELQSVSAQGFYPLVEGRVVPGAGLSWASFRITAGEEKMDAWSGSIGAVVRPTQSVSIDLQGQWLSNPIYSSDLRLFLKVNYWFKEQLGLFGREGK
jgi:hypothetical protein